MLSNRKSDNTSIQKSDITKKFIYDIYTLEKKFIQTENITYLTNSDLSGGTYRIKTPGIYKLSEDIIFNPNPGIKNDIKKKK